MLRYRVGFAIYWLIFAVLAVHAAENPGYVRHPELAPYPVNGLLIMWSVTALAVAAFYYILNPPLFRSSVWRLPLALVVCAMFLALSILFGGYTDLPGLYYIPGQFSALSMLILLVAAASTGAVALWHRVVKRA